MDYTLEKLEKTLGENTKEEWSNQTANFTEDEDIILKSVYESRIKFFLETDGSTVFYGLKRNGEEHACAILELTVKLPETKKAGLRLLNITLEPNHDVENRRTRASLKDAIHIISNCLVKAFELTYEEIPARTYKIYGRTDHMELILQEVKESILSADELSGVLDAKFEGRWLLIEKI